MEDKDAEDNKSKSKFKIKNGPKQQAKKGELDDTPPCKLCAIYGGNGASHGTKSCFKNKNLKRVSVAKKVITSARAQYFITPMKS